MSIPAASIRTSNDWLGDFALPDREIAAETGRKSQSNAIMVCIRRTGRSDDVDFSSGSSLCMPADLQELRGFSGGDSFTGLRHRCHGFRLQPYLFRAHESLALPGSGSYR